MSKRNSAKYKLDRRMGENIWGRPKSPVNKREYGPGQHGQRRKGKPTDFGTQLKAKQKLKGYYGNISEKQFRKYYAEAIRLKGDSSQNLVGLLERGEWHRRDDLLGRRVDDVVRLAERGHASPLSLVRCICAAPGPRTYIEPGWGGAAWLAVVTVVRILSCAPSR